MVKANGPRRPAPLKAVLQDLERTLARYGADPAHEAETDKFLRGCHAGFIDGLKYAIDAVQLEIGLSQNPHC
jgi:hypothetical protein